MKKNEASYLCQKLPCDWTPVLDKTFNVSLQRSSAGWPRNILSPRYLEKVHEYLLAMEVAILPNCCKITGCQEIVPCILLTQRWN